MIVVYAARHAIDPPPTASIPNEDHELHPEGKKFAEDCMGPALRKDIDTVISQHPNQPYTVEVFYGTSRRMQQTKDGIAKSLQGLNNVTYSEDPKLRARDTGDFYGLSRQERSSRYPDENAHFEFMESDLSIGGFKEIAKPPGKTSESELDVRRRVGDFLRDQKLEDVMSENPLPPLRIKIYISSGFHSLEVRRNLAAISLGAIHGNREHVEGSIYKLSGQTMHAMHDEGFLLKGHNMASATHSQRTR